MLKQSFEGSFNMVIKEVAWRRPPLSMKIALRIQKRIDWHVLLFLVLLDDMIGFFSPYP
jgi:hypothetical protein